MKIPPRRSLTKAFDRYDGTQESAKKLQEQLARFVQQLNRELDELTHMLIYAVDIAETIANATGYVSADGDGGITTSDTAVPSPHVDTHAYGGSDPFLSSHLVDAVVRRIRETSGPTDLLVGDIADGDLFYRNGTAAEGLTLYVETPSGTINGVNDTFTTTVAPVYVLWLSIRNLMMIDPDDYSISGNTITYTAASIPPSMPYSKPAKHQIAFLA